MHSVTETAIRRHLHTAVFGKTLIVEPLLPSTNTTARALAQDGAAEGTVVVAAAQSAGRGTRSRPFFSPQGGVYMSLILRPRAEDAGLITSCAAVAVARAIERLCPLTVHIKWVNDLYCGTRKLCGILSEAGFNPADNSLGYVVLGIGVNVAAGDFPPDIAMSATSLGNEGYTVDRPALIAAILEEWENLYASIGKRTFLAENRCRSCILGKHISVCHGDEPFEARAVAITDEGHLLVETCTKEQILLKSGEVSIKMD